MLGIDHATAARDIAVANATNSDGAAGQTVANATPAPLDAVAALAASEKVTAAEGIPERTAERWVAEVRLRVRRRIGELSKLLDTHERLRTGLRPNDGTQTKRETLAAAGLSKTEAHRCESLTNIPE